MKCITPPRDRHALALSLTVSFTSLKIGSRLLAPFLLCCIALAARSQWSAPDASNNIHNTNTGNVGIGTASPAAKLSVAGGIQVGTQIYWDWPNRAIDQFTESDGSSVVMRFRNSMNASNGNPLGGFDFAHYNGVSVMRINNANVGIGTTRPAYRLDVVAGGASDGMRLMYNNTGYVLLTPNTLGQGYYNNITQIGDAGLVYGNYNTTNPATSFGFVIAPWQNATSGLRMDASGNVGVCTADTKGYQLAVNGAAICTKMVVKTYASWPDYVFSPGYRLPSLDSVARYIRNNRHLPEMPSADSITGSGIDIGGNQAALLKKVEELTLYAIRQDEQLRRKDAQLRKQDKKLAEQEAAQKTLEARIARLESLMKKGH